MKEGVYQRIYGTDDIANYNWNEIDRALRRGNFPDLPTNVVRSERYLGFVDYKGKGFVMKLIMNRKGNYNLSKKVDEIYEVFRQFDKSVVDIELEELKRLRLMCPCEWLEYIDGVDKIKDLFFKLRGKSC